MNAPSSRRNATRLRRSLAAVAGAALLMAACSSDTPESLIASGKAFAAKKDHKAAVIQYKAALQRQPESGEARLLLGQALLATGDPVNAAVELTKALDQKQPAAVVVPSLARALLLTGEYKKLVTQYGDLTLDDKQAQASLKAAVATAWGALGNREKTEAAIEAANAAMPDYPPTKLLLARTAAGQRKFDEAVAIVDALLAKDPSLAEAWHLKGEILAYAKDEPKKGDEAFLKAIAAEPRYMPSYMALISNRIRQRDIPGARGLVAQMRQANPGHPLTNLMDAQVAFVDNDLAKSRELTQQLLRMFPDNITALQMAGAIEGQSGSLVQAEAHYAKALKLNPELTAARRGLALVYMKLGRPDQALETLKPLLGPDSRHADALALAGDAHLRLRDVSTAEQYFVRAAGLAPDDDRIRTALALAYISRGGSESAFAELEALATKAQDSYAGRALFAARMKRREFDKALQAVDGLAQKSVPAALLHEMRGQVQVAMRDYAAARRSFEAVLQAEPTNFSAASSLAGIDVLQGQNDAARKRFETAIAADPRNHFARMALAELRQRTNAPLDEVRGILVETIKLAPGEVGPRLQLINLLLAKRQYKDALSAAQDAVAAMPGNLIVLDAVGRAQMEAGDVEQAITTFRQIAGNSRSSALPHVRLADIYRVVGKRDAAEAALRKALELEPDLVEAQNGLVDLMVTGRKTKELAAMAKAMQARRPQAADGYAIEAGMHLRTGATDAALAVYKRALAVPGIQPAVARLHYLTLLRARRDAEADGFADGWLKKHPDDARMAFQVASISMARGRLEDAEKRLRRLVAAEPVYGLALNNLAWVLWKQGMGAEAVGFAQRAVNLSPEQPAFLDTLATVLASEKQYEQALAHQKKAVELAPRTPDLRLNLARIAIQAGDKTLARTELDALAKLGAAYRQQPEVGKLIKSL